MHMCVCTPAQRASSTVAAARAATAATAAATTKRTVSCTLNIQRLRAHTAYANAWRARVAIPFVRSAHTLTLGRLARQTIILCVNHVNGLAARIAAAVAAAAVAATAATEQRSNVGIKLGVHAGARTRASALPVASQKIIYNKRSLARCSHTYTQRF